ncbi:GAF domain-containing protein [Staphylococcus saprophyticus]|uniref:GAF domain-containing protein n=1 Tax=Staphylococcus saprophyticus TaxID=29385 RepID=UPI0015F18378
MTGTFLNYNSVTKQLKALIEDENEAITILSNTSSLLYWNLFDVNWLGFYFIKNNELILGPFQGKPACTHLKLNTGCVGMLYKSKKVLLQS